MLLIPKFLTIQNARLNCLYYVLLTVTFSLYIGWWVDQRKFNKQVDIRHDIDVSAFPHVAFADINSTFHTKLQSSICMDPPHVNFEEMGADYKNTTTRASMLALEYVERLHVIA